MYFFFGKFVGLTKPVWQKVSTVVG